MIGLTCALCKPGLCKDKVEVMVNSDSGTSSLAKDSGNEEFEGKPTQGARTGAGTVPVLAPASAFVGLG